MLSQIFVYVRLLACLWDSSETSVCLSPLYIMYLDPNGFHTVYEANHDPYLRLAAPTTSHTHTHTHVRLRAARVFYGGIMMLI